MYRFPIATALLILLVLSWPKIDDVFSEKEEIVLFSSMSNRFITTS